MTAVLVWIAAARRGIRAHALADPANRTACDRSTRTGQTLDAGDATARYQVTWCPTCWPGGGPAHETATGNSSSPVDGAEADTGHTTPAPAPAPASPGVGAGVTPAKPAAPATTYQGWRQVPAGLHSKTQLGDLDLPRVPGGPVRAHVETYDWRDKKTSVPLYALAESVPSPATIGQLEAARRRGDGGRVCDRCGAYPDRPLPADGEGLCMACNRARRLLEATDQAARDRVDVARWAAGILDPAMPPAVVLHVRQFFRPPAPSGRRNPDPIAVAVDAVDTTGARLVTATVRIAGPRVRSVPADAVDPAAIEEQICALLAAPVIVTWTSGTTRILRTLYGIDPPASWYGGNPNDLDWRATLWRGDVDPDTLTCRSALHPGRADRMLLILRRMAATAPREEPR